MVNLCEVLRDSVPWASAHTTCFSTCWLLAAEEPKLPINRLDPLTRTKVVMALLGLVILALGTMVCIRLGGRWVKRIVRSKPENAKASSAELPSDWDRKG